MHACKNRKEKNRAGASLPGIARVIEVSSEALSSRRVEHNTRRGNEQRLFAEVRDKLGLAYTIASYAEHLSDTGSLIVYAGVEPKKLSMAVEVYWNRCLFLRTKRFRRRS